MLLSRNAEEVNPTDPALLEARRSEGGAWRLEATFTINKSFQGRNITHSFADLLKKYSFEKPVSAVLKILRDVI